jgi:LPS sulfotransferase NodH
MTREEELIRAIIFLRNGDWQGAHDIAQSNEGSSLYDHLHAIVHKMEGDKYNARYWFSRAGVEMKQISIEEEINLFEARVASIK